MLFFNFIFFWQRFLLAEAWGPLGQGYFLIRLQQSMPQKCNQRVTGGTVVGVGVWVAVGTTVSVKVAVAVPVAVVVAVGLAVPVDVTVSLGVAVVVSDGVGAGHYRGASHEWPGH